MAGKLIIFSAPSGSGKTTLVRYLLDKGYPLEFSVSATTRPMRGKEVDGKDYHFLTKEAFLQKIAAGAFAEWEEVYKGTYYGTLRETVESGLSEGKNLVFDIDVEGGLELKKQFKEKALSIFIQPPSVQELGKRLKLRSTDSDEKIAERIHKATFELGYAEHFDVVLVNDKIEQAKIEIEKIVSSFIGKLPEKQ